MNMLSLDEKVERTRPFIEQAHLNADKLASVVQAAADRIKIAGDILDYVAFFVTAEQLTYDEAAFDKRLRIPSEAPGLLRKFGGVLGTIDPFNEKTTEACLQDFVVAEGISHAQIVHALRVAITGKSAGFGLFESVSILGRTECVLRIERALTRIP